MILTARSMEEIQTLQQINVLGDTTLTGQINVTNNTNSTSSTTGSITLAGGLGVAKDVFVNGNSNSNIVYLLDSSGTTLSRQYFSNGTTWKIENQVGNQTKTFNITQNAVTLNQSTPATSNNTGAVTVVGGISTQDNVWARGNIVGTTTIMTPSRPSGADSNIKNGIIFNSKSGLVNDNSGNLLVGVNTSQFGTRNNATQGGVIKINTDTSANPVFDFNTIASGATGQTSLLTIDQNGTVKVPSSTNSTSTTSGALQVAGGMAVAKNMNVGGTLSLWDGANSGTINETSANLNISSTNISLSGNVLLNGNVQISGNVTLNGTSSSGSSSSSSSSTDSNLLDDCILHSHIYNLANPSTTKTMLTSSYSLKDYSTTTTVNLTLNGLHLYAVRLIQGQIVKGVFFWSNSTNTIVRTGLYSPDGTRKISLDTNQTITGNNMKYLPLTNSTWTVDATGIFYVGILAVSGTTSLIASPTNSYANYGQIPITGKLNLTASFISNPIPSISISNLLADFDATTNVTTSSGKVSNWVDKISSISASQSTAANQPSLTNNFINTYPAIDFGSVNNSILITNNSQTTTSDLTLFFVMKLSGAKSGFSNFCSTRGSWVSNSIHILLTTNQLCFSVNINSASRDWLSGVYPTYGSPFLLCVNFSSVGGCVGRYRYNGATNASSYTYSTSSVALRNFFEIGNWSGDLNRTLNGGIGQFTYYNRTLTLNEMQQVEGFLAWRWGIQSNLPQDHPYSVSMPPTISGLTPSALTNLAYTGVYKDGV
jgi:hypothetical protein